MLDSTPPQPDYATRASIIGALTVLSCSIIIGLGFFSPSTQVGLLWVTYIVFCICQLIFVIDPINGHYNLYTEVYVDDEDTGRDFFLDHVPTLSTVLVIVGFIVLGCLVRFFLSPTLHIITLTGLISFLSVSFFFYYLIAKRLSPSSTNEPPKE